MTQTDTEVVAHHLALRLKETGDLTEALRETVGELEGSFTIVALAGSEPDRVVAARRTSRLLLASVMGRTSSAPTSPRSLVKRNVRLKWARTRSSRLRPLPSRSRPSRLRRLNEKSSRLTGTPTLRLRVALTHSWRKKSMISPPPFGTLCLAA